jgi:TonB-linked SusC/RagA family outer membrane protein
MRRLIQALLLLLVFVPGTALAQTRGTIEGTVTDAETEETLPGVNIALPDLQRGAATNAQGEYQIERVPAGSYTLRASFVGYQTRERQITVRAGERTVVNFSMVPAEVGLEEVVVTALGVEQEQRSLGYSTTEVEGAAVAETAEPNVVNALAGKVPGLKISSSSGQPGMSSRITIRGNNSYQEGGNSPLIVVDGMVVSNASDDNPTGPSVFTGGTSNRLLDIDPNAIANINVLKGASATALYGSRAANGAIVITTKGGEGVSGVRASYTTSVGYSQAIIDGYQNEYLQGTDGGYRNGLLPDRGGYNELADPNSPLFDPDASPRATQTASSWGPHRDSVSQAVVDSIGQPRTFDPQDDFYEDGVRTENSVTLSGSGNFGNASVTITDSRNDGIVPTTQYNRSSVQAKYSANLSDALAIQATSQYSQSNQDFMLEANGPNSYQWGLFTAPISFDLTDTEYDDGTQRTYSAGSQDNPVWLTDRLNLGSSVNRFIGNFEISYDFTDWLTVKERIGIDTYGDTRKEEINSGTAAEPTGSTYDQSITRTEVNSDLTVSARRGVTEDLSVDLLVGNNISRREYTYDYIEGTGIGVEDFFNISNFSTTDQDAFDEEQVLIGAYANGTLNYRDYAYLTLSARNDWSSTLPEGNRSYFYPSASLSFVFTDAFDGAFENTPLSFGRFRASVAQVGSDTSPYQLRTTFIQAAPGDGQRGEITFPFQGVNGFEQEGTRANPNLQPEISTEYEFGTDLRFLNGRANLDVTYYNKSTTDQIFDVPVSSATGFTEQSRNAGEIVNRGWEVQLGGTPLQRGDFTWDLSANWSKNTTEVKELASGVENIFLFGFTSIQVRAETGEDGYGIIFGSRYRRNGEISEDNPVTVAGEERTAPLAGFDDDALLIAADGTPLPAASPGNIGNVQPDWEGGLFSTFSWRGLSLSQQWEISRGAEILNFDRFYTEFRGTFEGTEDRGTEVTEDGIQVTTGEQNEVSFVKDQSFYQGPDGLVFERYVEDASYVKLRQVALSYQFSLPDRVRQSVGLRSLRLQLTGRNLLTFTDFSMGDPVGSLAGSGNGQGFYHGVTPSTRTYQASLTLGF